MCIDFLEESESYVMVILDMSTKGMDNCKQVRGKYNLWFIARIVKIVW